MTYGSESNRFEGKRLTLGKKKKKRLTLDKVVYPLELQSLCFGVGTKKDMMNLRNKRRKNY